MSMPPIPVNPVHAVDCHMGVRVEGRPDNPIVCYKTQEGRHKGCRGGRGCEGSHGMASDSGSCGEANRVATGLVSLA